MSGELYDFSSIMAANVTRSTVGFIDVGRAPPMSLGSATPIRFGAIAGLLTCAHVVEALRSRAEFGIVMFPARGDALQNTRLSFERTTPVTIAAATWNPNGPDIGFLKLSDADMATLEAQVSVVDGEQQFQEAIGAHQADAVAIEIVAGVIHAWTKGEATDGQRATARITGLANVGHVRSVSMVDEFDILRFEPVPALGFTMPPSFEGTSGGGLWRLFVEKQPDGTYLCRRRDLLGVAFYEQNSQILCHGPRSIYRRLRQKIMSELE